MFSVCQGDKYSFYRAMRLFRKVRKERALTVLAFDVASDFMDISFLRRAEHPCSTFVLLNAVENIDKAEF